MTSGKRKRLTLEEELEEFRAATADPASAGFREKLRAALQSRHSLLAARAAGIVKSEQMGGFAPDLLGAFDRFLNNPVKSDPSCLAKLAVLEALEATGHPDAEPFLVAARYVQLEPSWGPPVDTAVGLRARAVMALANMAYQDLLLLGAELLADPEVPVRIAAAEALAHHGDRLGAGLLLLKLRHGDDDPLVLLECLGGLLSLAPDWGLPVLKAALLGSDEELREMATLALGESGREDALRLLLEYLDSGPVGKDWSQAVRALGLHRSDGALQRLLTLITNGSTREATAAIEALAPRRFERVIRDRVAKAVHETGKPGLSELMKKAFSDGPD